VFSNQSTAIPSHRQVQPETLSVTALQGEPCSQHPSSKGNKTPSWITFVDKLDVLSLSELVDETNEQPELHEMAGSFFARHGCLVEKFISSTPKELLWKQ
jgi:hypothetical protein